MGKDGLDKAREIRHVYRMVAPPYDFWQEVSLVRPIFVMQDGARYHTSKAMEEFIAAHDTRLTNVQ
jgi:hypothetical protein